MTAFILSSEAEHDLEIIRDYLLERAGIRRTRQVMRELRAGICLVAKNPEAGHVRKELTEESVKFWSVFSYLIVYDPAKKPVEIARVLHGRRDIEGILNRFPSISPKIG